MIYGNIWQQIVFHSDVILELIESYLFLLPAETVYSIPLPLLVAATVTPPLAAFATNRNRKFRYNARFYLKGASAVTPTVMAEMRQLFLPYDDNYDHNGERAARTCNDDGESMRERIEYGNGPGKKKGDRQRPGRRLKNN